MARTSGPAAPQRRSAVPRSARPQPRSQTATIPAKVKLTAPVPVTPWTLRGSLDTSARSIKAISWDAYLRPWDALLGLTFWGGFGWLFYAYLFVP